MKNSPSQFLRWSSAIGIVLGIVFGQLQAQSATRQRGIDGATARAIDVSDARALVSVGDLAGAEQILYESNIHKGNGAKAKFEQAFKLSGLALSFANLSERARARELAGIAIVRLREVETECVKEHLNSTAARAMELIGSLEEGVFGNQKEARRAYETALTHNPSSRAALLAIARWTREEADFQNAQVKRGGR